MVNKIFLNAFNGKKSVNTSEGLNMSLMGKRRLLPTNDFGEVISQNDIYMEERRKCDTIRLTCQVNPICSNVLFNHITEIVKDEGSSAVTYINYGIASGSSEDITISEKIVYKPKTMSFWSGNTMKYMVVEDSENIPETDFGMNSELDGNTSLNTVKSKHPTNTIRDTQLSNDGYVYHCGLDILNNHLIRSNTFKTVCKCGSEELGDYTAFNTLADMMRDVNGNKVYEALPFPVSAGVKNNAKLICMHLYEYDDIDTFKGCVSKKLKAKYDGWCGFYNKSKIKSYKVFSVDHTRNKSGVEEELEIERPIMYKSGGDFVDMYPDRSLFSFNPKYNKYRNRQEKNWNYCLTYPSSSTTDGFEEFIEKNNNSLKAIYFDENTRADNGVKQLVIYSISKHGLKQGDYVNIYKTIVDDEGKSVTTKIIDNAEVAEIADDYVFTVFNADVQISKTWVEYTDNVPPKEFVVGGKTYILDNNGQRYKLGDNNVEYYYILREKKRINFDGDAQHISYKKVVNDIECDYYVRIFSKIPNFKNASADTSSEYEIYKNDGELIKEYQKNEYDFESHASKLAFAKNIYSDEIGEVVFTDDINIANLKDNLGRPLSSIYFTIVKNNKGYKEWYGYDYPNKDWAVTDISASTVEHSHCFGRISCGMDMSLESSADDSLNSIYNISLINAPFGFKIGEKINEKRKYTLENNKEIEISNYEVWFDFDKNYYGDLCYYDSYNAIERSIQPILHRVNTAQRESNKSSSVDYYENFVYDEIYADDYDTSDYTISAYTISNTNSYKEGYYYRPHYEIPIRTFDKLRTAMPDFLTMKSLTNTSEDTTRITTLERHFLSIGDKAVICDSENNKYYYCTAVSGKNNSDRTFTCKIYDEKGAEVHLNNLNQSYNAPYDSSEYDPTQDILNFKLFKIDNLDIPSYAKILKDGTCRLIWRDIVNNGFNESDKSVEEYPFTNGAFYINKRIDLYLRRQDPYDIYGLYSEDDLLGIDVIFESEDNYVKEKDITC